MHDLLRYHPGVLQIVGPGSEDIALGEILRLAWKRWNIVGDAYGDFQGRFFAVLFYFTLFVPFAVAVRLLTDPLQIRKLPGRWLERAGVGNTLDEARRQF